MQAMAEKKKKAKKKKAFNNKFEREKNKKFDVQRTSALLSKATAGGD